MTLRLRRALALSSAAGLLTLSACSGSGEDKKATPSSSSSPSPTRSATSAPPPKPTPRPKNPLTGLGPVPSSAVVAVKIDDTDGGRPQLNVDKADNVYVLQVEGGLTRLIAVFASKTPGQVGYVRSTRPGDADLLLEYGKIIEAYSGGARDVLPGVRNSGIRTWSQDDGRAYYTRQPRDNDHGYINVVLDVNRLAHSRNGPRPRSIGWTFGAALPAAATRARGIRTTVGSTAVEFRWDAGLKKYVRYIGGVRQLTASGQPIAATNVIVQQCVVETIAHTDVLGNHSQVSHTSGHGGVSVFRDATRINGSWSRAGKNSPTLLRAAGRPIPLHPGNTWVVLVAKGTAVSS